MSLYARHVDADLAQELFGADDHLLAVQDAQAAKVKVAFLPAEEEVGQHVEMLGQRQVLVHRLDAGLAGVARTVEGCLAAGNPDRALGGGLRAREDLDEGRLARAVIADDRHHLARHHFEVGAGESDDPTVVLGDPDRLDNRNGVQRCLPSLGFCW